MSGLPVTVRLLDTPLHEFLPALPLVVAPEDDDEGSDEKEKERQMDRMMQEVRCTLRSVVRLLTGHGDERESVGLIVYSHTVRVDDFYSHTVRVDDEKCKIDELV